jgi:spermidine synthase
VVLTVIGFGISGAASMIYEVAWTRALALIIGSSTYAFSTMLVAFLTGLALGSFLFARAARRLAVTPLTFGLLQLGVGLAALLLIPVFEEMPEWFLAAFRVSSAATFIRVVQFAISLAAMLVPTILIGGTFPCAAQVAARAPSRVGHDVGAVYSINTVGAIVGTVLGGFLLIPLLGLSATIKVAIGLNLGVAAVLCLVTGRGWTRTAGMTVAVAAWLALLLIQPWDPRVMSSGISIYAERFLPGAGKWSLRQAVGGSDLLFYKDGLSATVSVHRLGASVTLRVNGKADASNSGDMHTQLMSGHIPLLHHPAPKTVLVIGLGSGVTVGAVAQYPVAHIDAVEIEPAVAEAARFFQTENRGVLNDKRVHLAITDGRNFVQNADRAYDVIISEPSNPWIGGIGSLFSMEFYRLAARRLARDGIICQWVQGYNLFPDDLRMVVATLRTVFPHTTVWSTGPGDYLLVGSRVPLSLDYARLARLYKTVPALREDMARAGLASPLALLADFALSEDDTTRYADGALLNTDDLPLLEFSAPHSIYADTVALNASMMDSFKTLEAAPGPGLTPGALDSAGVRHDLGLAYAHKGRPQRAIEEFTKALRQEPRHVASLVERGRALAGLRVPLRAEADFRAAVTIDPRAHAAHAELGALYQAQGMPDLAERHLRKALDIDAQNPHYAALLAQLYRAGRRFELALAHYGKALEARPDDVRLLEGKALAFRELGRLQDAVSTLQLALALDSRNAQLHVYLGELYARMHQYGPATQALDRAAALNPLLPSCYIALGRIHLLQHAPARAIEAWEKALRLDPANVPLRREIQALYATVS